MNRAAGRREPPEPEPWIRRLPTAPLQMLDKCCRYVTEGARLEYRVIIKEKDAAPRLTDPNRVLQHRREDRLKIGGRTADHLQNIACRRLVLERLGKIARARLHSRLQSRIGLL